MDLKMNKVLIYRGSVWLVDLEPVRGHEQGSKRPCLIISDDLFNNSPSQLVAVIPITKRFRPLVWFIPLDPPEGGLKMRSYIITNQLRVIIRDRISGSCLGTISPKILRLVEER